MRIDIEELKSDLKENDYGAFFMGGFGGAILEVAKIDKMTEDDVIEMAKNNGIDLKKYQK